MDRSSPTEGQPWQPATQQTHAERPLPPTPEDNGTDLTSTQGARPEPTSPPEEQDADDEVEDEDPGPNTSQLRRKDYPPRTSSVQDRRYGRIEDHDAASEGERQPTALEGPSQEMITPQDGAAGDFRGPDLSNLDIYGSSGDEGPGPRNIASRAVDGPSSSSRHRDGATTRRKSRSIPHHSSHRGEGFRNEEGVSRLGPPAGPYTPFSQTRRRRSTRSEVVVPRWQPDAEVTFCPICRTQFSFFVRKHHCRKCGRVVCNSCSPHRITIPYQYIVQPPTDISPAASRTSVDATRVGSSLGVASVGGGERVRLCNPCVPDPNTTPLQTRPDGHSPQQPSHSRSVSSAAVPYSPSGREQSNPRNYYPQNRQSSGFAIQNQAREWMTGNAAQQGISSSLGGLGSPLLRPEGLESRSRSSTVGSTRDPHDVGDVQYSRSTQHLVPRSEANLSRALPNPPDSHPRTQTTRRRRIAEDDECWVCHEELPSRTLPDHEALREAHVAACVQSALDGTLRSTPPPRSSSQNNDVSVSVSTSGHITTSRSSNSTSTPSAGPPPPPPASIFISEPIANTPEARTAQRERNHAAVVYGRSPFASSSSGHGVLSRVIPYVGSEKDCVDDAECTICLEEFEVGQHMGRLECFCRFHMSCIQGWFEQKPGKCPVHGVDN